MVVEARRTTGNVGHLDPWCVWFIMRMPLQRGTTLSNDGCKGYMHSHQPLPVHAGSNLYLIISFQFALFVSSSALSDTRGTNICTYHHLAPSLFIDVFILLSLDFNAQ